MKELDYPFDPGIILRKQKALKRKLLAEGQLNMKKRIAVLNGSTATDFINCLELFLLQAGIEPSFYESEYNMYFEETVFPNEKLDLFSPEIIIIYTSVVNLNNLPDVSDSECDISDKVETEFKRYQLIWDTLREKYNCVIIQNNFDFPVSRSMGNGELTDERGIVRYVTRLNALFAEYCDSHVGFYVHDINYLSAKYGLYAWHKRPQYYAYKIAISTSIVPHVSFSASKLICALSGIVKKCIVLDLDNTLWGGVIGEDGLDGIVLGNDTPIGESYIEFQKYLLDLKCRGIILAVCSKNDDTVARLGFEHPDSILKTDDFAVFKANWNNKDVNIKEIAAELNIGLDSFVFVDDNPVERDLVRQSLPMVATPDINPDDVFSYIEAIEENGYFAAPKVSADDLKRNESYLNLQKIKKAEEEYGSYNDFLISLSMKAEISSFKPVYYERIAQLTNKSNQFNLTTKRCSVADIKQYAEDENCLTLYARLKDKYGDNGLVSVVAGRFENDALNIEIWLMSCRVLKRNLELAVFDEILSQCMCRRGISKIRGYYYPTEKNALVRNHYDSLGFQSIKETEQGTEWEYMISEKSKAYNTVIEVIKE